MIKNYFLWKRLADYGKKFQSGTDVVDDFNTKLAEVQLEVSSNLSPYYQGNELVRGIMETWVKSITGTSSLTGEISRPAVGDEKFMRIVSMGYVDVQGNYICEMYESIETEIAIASRIEQRRPSVANKIIPYIPYDKKIQLYPKQAIAYQIFYLIYPTEATIAFDYETIDGEDVMTYNEANTVDLEWDENATNLILYHMLEKYGITNRDLLIAEYGKLGITLSKGGTQ